MCSYETGLDNNGILNRYFVSGVSICGWYLESVFALGIVIILSIVSCTYLLPFLTRLILTIGDGISYQGLVFGIAGIVVLGYCGRV